MHVLADVFSHSRLHLVGAAVPGWIVGVAAAAASFAFTGSDATVGALLRGATAGLTATVVVGGIVLRQVGLPSLRGGSENAST